MRELSLDELHYAAVRRPRIAVVAPTVEDARAAAENIFGLEARGYIMAQAETDHWPRNADVVLVDREARPRREQSDETVIEFSRDEPVEHIRQALFRAGDDLELALGRQFPELRQAAAQYVVKSTSRVNAQFALASNLPALVPVVGGIMAAGADTIVLTKNQLMMIYKLAAIHGRDIDNRWRIYREMVPVVGAGLFWRTVARDLAAMIPFAAGTAPKVAIAFAGTYAAGMAAHVYYLEGRKPGAEQMRRFYKQGLRELREVPALLRGLPGKAKLGRETATDPVIVDVPYRSSASPDNP